MTELRGTNNRPNRWAALDAVELSELSIALDHRLAEAEAGNAYVWWGVAGEMLADLYFQYPELSRDQTHEDVRERLAELTRRAVQG